MPPAKPMRLTLHATKLSSYEQTNEVNKLSIPWKVKNENGQGLVLLGAPSESEVTADSPKHVMLLSLSATKQSLVCFAEIGSLLHNQPPNFHSNIISLSLYGDSFGELHPSTNSSMFLWLLDTIILWTHHPLNERFHRKLHTEKYLTSTTAKWKHA